MQNNNLLYLLKLLWSHLTPRRHVQLVLFLLLMLAAAVAEVVGLGAVLPFLGILTQPEYIFQHEYAQPMIQFMGIDTPKDLLAPLTWFFCVAVVMASILRLVLVWIQNRLGQAIGVDISDAMYRRLLYQSYAEHVRQNSSEVVSIVSEKPLQVVSFVFLPLLRLIGASVITLCVLAVLIVVEPVVTITAISFFGGIYLFKAKLSKQYFCLLYTSPSPRD